MNNNLNLTKRDSRDLGSFNLEALLYMREVKGGQEELLCPWLVKTGVPRGANNQQKKKEKTYLQDDPIDVRFLFMPGLAMDHRL
uniref:Uncharacterized protein n=1 Tax=Steinernema glaseri TaxID=37863 RepID=A0A1I7ZE55_9BILA